MGFNGFTSRELSPNVLSSTPSRSLFYVRNWEFLMSVAVEEDPYFQKLFAERIGGAQYGKGNEIYKFEKIKRAKRKALADFPNRGLLDFGIGENDSMALKTFAARWAKKIHRPENRGYADNGIGEFKQAVSRFMERKFMCGSILQPRSITALAARQHCR